NSGQQITIDVKPDSNLLAEVTVEDQNGTVIGFTSAAAAGDEIFLNLMATNDLLGNTSTYTIIVDNAGSGTAGLYDLNVTLNAALSNEAQGGGTNDTIATAQPLDSTFLSVGTGISRTAVLGTINPSGALSNNDVFVLSRGDSTVKHYDTNGNLIGSFSYTGGV